MLCPPLGTVAAPVRPASIILPRADLARGLITNPALHEPATLDHSLCQGIGAHGLIAAGMIKTVTALDEKAVNAREPQGLEHSGDGRIA
ncbi:hypothetical protein XH81_04245 [Bradyrhizobium sp. CCBAU 25360]|nr:hypothetical protein [Bradyrhizobium sp. CCBAU 25360]